MPYPTMELPVKSGTISLPQQYRTFTGSVSVTFHIPEHTKATKRSYKDFLGKYPPVLEDNDNIILSELLAKKYA
ncbi:MAG: hypothetical protein Q8K26_01465 [Candidatus Gracilibacteria bacterium]|nr:hypothetical protein [Candidatus Gracilibacteria bacterium]